VQAFHSAGALCPEVCNILKELRVDYKCPAGEAGCNARQCYACPVCFDKLTCRGATHACVFVISRASTM
jgi:hypothetical protein